MSHAMFALPAGIESAYVALRKRRAGKGICRRSFKAEESPMSTFTYDVAATNQAGTPATAPVRKRKGLFARFMEARQRQAIMELRRHGLQLPRELEEAGLKIGERNEDSLPFV